MGRKRTHEDAARTHMVTVRLRPDTYTRLVSNAVRLGMTRASYVEHLIENRRVETGSVGGNGLPIPLINQLKRLGNNLNQIAHAINAGLPPNVMDAAGTLRDLIRLLVEDELTGRRLRDAAQGRSHDRDPPSPPPGHELQGSMRLHLARRLERQDG